MPTHTPKHKVIITARHHACESMASFELEGLIDGILNEVSLKYLRENVEFQILPFMDKDGIENGDQGKNRIPRDHNQDYIGESMYHSTAALRKEVPVWSEGKLRIALDLHCPWIKGGEHEVIQSIGSSDPEMAEEQIVFSKLLEKNSVGDIKLYHKDFLYFGTSWNKHKKGPNPQTMSFRRWVSNLEGIRLASTLEFPYANISGAPVTRDGARAFGKAVAYSIMDYLKLLDEKNH